MFSLFKGFYGSTKLRQLFLSKECQHTENCEPTTTSIKNPYLLCDIPVPPDRLGKKIPLRVPNKAKIKLQIDLSI